MKKYSVRMSFTVPAGTKALMKTKAAAQGISMSELIRRETSEDDLAIPTR
jgi:predicted HicB family RNase H-like nuclease